MPNALASELYKLAKMVEGAARVTTYLWKYECKNGHTFDLTDPKGPSSTPPKQQVVCPFDKSIATLVKPVRRYRVRVDESAEMEDEKGKDKEAA